MDGQCTVPAAKPARAAPGARGLCRPALACLLLSGLAGAAGEPAAAAAPALSYEGVRAGRIVFLGNSITLHGPLASIGWAGNWGMAASAPEKDYVHLVLDAIARAAGGTPESRVDNIADIERQYAAIDIEGRVKDHLAFRPDIVVLAIGENVPPLTAEADRQAFEAAVTRLLDAFRKAGAGTLVVRSCFWADPAKDEALRRACAAVGGVFADIGALGRDPANAARSERAIEHAGVAAHPGDRGMQAIAQTILSAIKGARP